jgi:3-carboxy-cis,cis-muconate cycloisomerase
MTGYQAADTGSFRLTGDVYQGEFGLLSPVSASPLVAALTGDRAVLAAILAVESGWAAVLEQHDLAPSGSAAVVAHAADPSRYDLTDGHGPDAGVPQYC